MISDRDKKILSWIEEYKTITVKQATWIFFKGNYEGCRRRLKQLEGYGFIKSYTTKFKQEKAYYMDKKLSDHDLLIYDFIKEVYRLGGSLYSIKLQPRYLNDMIRPDALLTIALNDLAYFILLEVDYTHYTSINKIILYEQLYSTNELQTQCHNTFPILLIARPTHLNINNTSFKLIQTDLNFADLNNSLFIKNPK